MEVIQRYIYAVVQKLPPQQRADIEKELQGLIEDMVDERIQRGEQPEAAVEQTLLELGHPGQLAAKYRGSKRYLIGPAYFDGYLIILKIVLLSIAAGLTISFVLQSILQPLETLEHFVHYLVNLFSAGLQGFAWVTIVFALIEYWGVGSEKLEMDTHKGWSPSKLPPIPDPKVQIRPLEPIIGMVWAVLVLMLLTFSPQFLGAIHLSGGQPVVIPVFDLEVFRRYLPLIWIWFLLGILMEVFKLVVRKWTRGLLLYKIFFNLSLLAIAVVVLSDPGLWNPHFLQEMVEQGMLSPGGEAYQAVAGTWHFFTQNLLFILIVLTLVDTLYVVWRAVRMRRVDSHVM